MNSEVRYDSNMVINKLSCNEDYYVQGHCVGKEALNQNIVVGGVTYKKGEVIYDIVFNDRAKSHVYMTRDYLKKLLMDTSKIVNLKLDSIGRIIEDKEVVNREKKISEIKDKIFDYMQTTLKNGGCIKICEIFWDEGVGIEENCDHVFDSKLAELAKELIKYEEFNFIEDLCDLFMSMLNSIVMSSANSESKIYSMITNVNTIDMKKNFSAAGSIESFINCLIDEVEDNNLMFMAYESTDYNYEMCNKTLRPTYIDLISRIGSTSRLNKLSNEFIEEVCGLWYTLLLQADKTRNYSFDQISFLFMNDSARTLLEKVWLNCKSHFELIDKDIKVIKELYNNKSIDNSEIIGLEGYMKPKSYVKEALEKASKANGEYVADENETAAIITTISALHKKDVNSVKVVNQGGFWEVYEVIPLGISVTFNSNDTARKNAVIKTSKH